VLVLRLLLLVVGSLTLLLLLLLLLLRGAALPMPGRDHGGSVSLLGAARVAAASCSLKQAATYGGSSCLQAATLVVLLIGADHDYGMSCMMIARGCDATSRTQLSGLPADQPGHEPADRLAPGVCMLLRTYTHGTVYGRGLQRVGRVHEWHWDNCCTARLRLSRMAT
jgi:hypothetical protein